MEAGIMGFTVPIDRHTDLQKHLLTLGKLHIDANWLTVGLMIGLLPYGLETVASAINLETAFVPNTRAGFFELERKRFSF